MFRARGCEILPLHPQIRSCAIERHRQDENAAVLGLETGEGLGGVVKGVINAVATEEEAITRFDFRASSNLPTWFKLRCHSRGIV